MRHPSKCIFPIYELLLNGINKEQRKNFFELKKKRKKCGGGISGRLKRKVCEKGNVPEAMETSHLVRKDGGGGGGGNDLFPGNL